MARSGHLRVTRDFREHAMPYSSPTPTRWPAAAGTAFILVALALGGVAHPVHASEAPAKPATDATVRIKAFPPSVQVGTTTVAAKDDTAAPTSVGKRGEVGVRVDSDEDFDFDAFNSQVHKMPWVIALIFLVVGSIFLTPVILLIGIIWYKLRKTRLQNEAMLALAARGVVPAAQAADALATGASPASVAPQVYQQAVALRKRVIWSDLRKGVILAMIGLGFLFYGITGRGEPSWIGLVLLFVGAGYIVLWWLEGRHLEQAGASRAGNDASTSSGGG
jgi:hypothetical protein